MFMNRNHFRFVNIAQRSQVDQSTLLSLLKEVRMEMLSRPDDIECQERTQLLSDDLLRDTNDKIEERLNMNTSYIPLADINEETLEMSGRYFTYLNFCFPKSSKILKFFEDLFIKASVKEILMGLSSILTTTRNAEKEVALKIWNKFGKYFDLSYNKIDIPSSRKNGSESIPYGIRTSDDNLEFGKVTELIKLSNHPVHIQDEDGMLSPTALIPFCSFADNFSVMGVRIDKFEVPVCKSFAAKIVRGQICYTVDPNKFKTNINPKNDLLYLSLFIDYNEDREVLITNDSGLSDIREAYISIESIGKHFKNILHSLPAT